MSQQEGVLSRNEIEGMSQVSAKATEGNFGL